MKVMKKSGGNEGQQDVVPGNSPSSLLPMLISGLVLTVIGMIAVAAFT
jgi:hypothetical protein